MYLDWGNLKLLIIDKYLYVTHILGRLGDVRYDTCKINTWSVKDFC